MGVGESDSAVRAAMSAEFVRGVTSERERVRAVLIAEMKGWDGGDAHDAIHGLAARLGIDLRQPAGKGEGT